MTQDERWLLKYNEVKEFIERERRNPSTGMGDRLLMCGKWCGGSGEVGVQEWEF